MNHVLEGMKRVKAKGKTEDGMEGEFWLAGYHVNSNWSHWVPSPAMAKYVEADFKPDLLKVLDSFMLGGAKITLSDIEVVDIEPPATEHVLDRDTELAAHDINRPNP